MAQFELMLGYLTAEHLYIDKAVTYQHIVHVNTVHGLFITDIYGYIKTLHKGLLLIDSIRLMQL